MKRFIQTFLICVSIIVAAMPAAAQKPDAYPRGTVRVVLTDNSAVVGVIEREDEEEIVLRTTAGVLMTIPRDKVKSTVDLEGERFFRVDPNRTRLLFAPTGRALGDGTGYVSFYEIFVPFVAVGAGRSVTLAGGMTINPGSERFIYAAPKVTVIERKEVSVALGGIGVALLGDGGDGSAGLFYGVGTFGPPHASLTAGMAFGFVNGKFGENPVLLLGGEVQLSNHVKLLTENYVFVGFEDAALISGGIRFFGDKLAADIGFFTVPSLFDEGGFPFIPWLGFAFNFGG